MAEVEKFMTVDAGDIAKIMNIETGDIEAVMGVDMPASGGDWFGTRHFLNGHSADTTRISYKSSTSNGDVSDFGNLIYLREMLRGSGTGSGKARGIAGSDSDGVTGYIKAIDYYATTSTTNSSDFGDSDVQSGDGAGMSNGTLMFFGGGSLNGDPYIHNALEYITIASAGNGTNAGDLLDAVHGNGSVSGNTRAASFGGITRDYSDDYANYAYATVDYIAFHTSNNAADFGDLSAGTYYGAGCASTTRWVLKGGHRYTNASGHVHHIHMDYYAADTLGNAGDFGDIAGRTQKSSAMADGTRGEWWGGHETTGDNGSTVDSIAYITIASAGDGTDAGNLHAAGNIVSGGLSGAAS